MRLNGILTRFLIKHKYAVLYFNRARGKSICSTLNFVSFSILVSDPVLDNWLSRGGEGGGRKAEPLQNNYCQRHILDFLR